MALLEDIKNGAIVQGIMPGVPVEVVSVDWIGQQAVNLVYRVPGGSVAETTLYRDDEHRSNTRLEVFTVGRRGIRGKSMGGEFGVYAHRL